MALRTDEHAKYAVAVPINALTAHGFGPFGHDSTAAPGRRLAQLRSSLDGVYAAIETIGVTPRRIMTVLAAYGGAASAEQLAFQTQHADPAELSEAMERLVVAGVVARDQTGALAFAPVVRDLIATTTRSLADHGGPTSDVLELVCRTLRVDGGTRKQERLDAIAAAFADPEHRRRIVADLSADAVRLLDRVAAAAGAATTSGDRVGLPLYAMIGASNSRSRYQYGPVRPEIAVLHELTGRAIVGIDEHEGSLWIWREAWPLVDKPFVRDWSTAPVPARVRITHDGEPRLPATVNVADHALRLWQAHPPVVLKTDEPRLGKQQVRTTAHELRVREASVDVVARIAISLGLLLRNEVGRSGRGRNRRIDEAWMVDPAAYPEWAALDPMHRFVRLVAEWCAPRLPCDHQLLANRHLVLWELSQLAEGEAYSDADAFAAWFADRYASLGHPEAVAECLTDLRALGVVTDDAVALTALARAVFDDAAAVIATVVEAATSAFVQSDLTVVAPAHLRHDLAAALERIAIVESSSGAVTYRLDAARITRAVQAGDSAEEIVDLLAELSATALPDTVTRLVADAAGRAGSVKVISAATVVVVSDPADLTTACAIKALKLTRVADVVATTDVSPAKVRAALERKGLAPQSVVAAAGRPRSSFDDAAPVEQRAAHLRAIAGGRSGGSDAEADLLERRARSLKDVSARFAVTRPLTLTAKMVRDLSGGAAR